MSANTETTGADRTKCKAFCGMTIEDIKSDKSADCEWRDAPMEPHLWHNYRRYCTPACRDARLPPIAAPAAHIERRKGQRWHMRNVKLGADFSGVLAEDTGATWKLSDVVAMDGEGTDRRFRADMWATPGTTMTLLADATPEPAKCEPWCGNDLPPEGRPGWGFLLDDDANVAERFKLGRAGFTKRDLAIGWCTDECRESYISKTGFREMKSPSVQEAYPATPCVKCGRAHTGGCGYGAQEAPKAAPVQFWFTDDEGEKIGPFATGLEADDASVAYGAWMRTQTGKPYAGPARLPRPQLAADWVEDCLGDVR